MNVLKDKYGREINYIRFSVTKKCNLNCFYCHKEGIEKIALNPLKLLEVSHYRGKILFI